MAKTKKDYFAQLKEIVKDNAELVAFIDHEVELLTRKNSGNSQTKTQKDNEAICEMLVNELAKIGKPVTITDLMEASDVVKNYTYETKVDGKIKIMKLSNQKISALFRQLSESQKIVKVTDKKKTFFSVSE